MPFFREATYQNHGFENKVFPTANESERYCIEHALEMNMVDIKQLLIDLAISKLYLFI